MSGLSHGKLIKEFTALLTNIEAEIRFWAAYCLSQQHGADLTIALEQLDRVVAYDHTVPRYFGWHVDREALLPYEYGYFKRLFPKKLGEDEYSSPAMALVSPAPEYFTFYKDYRVWREDWTYETKPIPPVTLQVEPDWLAMQIKKRWRNAELNVREPRPTAYLLDFKLIYRKWQLIGGLHRDGYGLVLTGD